MEDFGGRCAYSLIHKDDISGHNMEVDHHNPTIKGRKLHSYGNLYPAFSLCNNAKRGVWPKPKDVSKRRRFLDCCKEQDYGTHIFEDAQTGALHTITPEGFYHVENCDLNNEWFKKRRRERTDDGKLLGILEHFLVQANGSEKVRLAEAVAIFKMRLERAIPPIGALPIGADVI